MENLGKFDSDFRFSVFASMIDNVDDSIVSNSTSITLKKKVYPLFNGTRQAFSVSYFNAIQPGSFRSNEFTVFGSNYTYHLADDYNGAAVLMNEDIVINANVGDINYGSGVVSLNPLNVEESELGDNLSFTIIPLGSDVTGFNDQIMLIEEEDISIAILEDN